MTGVLVAEALGHGDMGLAVALLAPAAVSNALVLWGDEHQQATYLPSFTGDDGRLPRWRCWNRGRCSTRSSCAPRPAGGTASAGRREVAGAAGREAELFVIAAQLEAWPRPCSWSSPARPGDVEAEPSMGLRAAGLGRLMLDGVTPSTALAAGWATPTTTAIASGSAGSAGARSPLVRRRPCWTT